jgi:hypothetical protein
VPQIVTAATEKLKGWLSANEGVPATVAALSMDQPVQLSRVLPHQIVAHNVPAEIMERSTYSKYPLFYVYCSKLTNELKEKFRTFSGAAHMVVETRVSQDRLEDLGAVLQIYTEAVIQVLDNSRGDWGDGVFYCGGYEITFGAVKQGGRNFIQAAKISFVLQISAD